MKVKYIIEKEDIVKEVHVKISPIEYLIISASLKQYAENPKNHKADIEVAKRMREYIGTKEQTE